MLQALCGNKNVQRILIFLFVNGRCYGTQLHRSLKTALTPLQKALNRLETGGIITSYYEGKTRLYQFNPSYPLLNELEQLLKKSYTLMPAHEKKDYYVVKDEVTARTLQKENHAKVLLTFWEKLKNISQLTFHAKTKTKDINGWNGKGKGEVTVTKENDHTLIFHEKGSWINQQGAEVGFSNIFRWSIDRLAGVISLEHLRRGADNPVLLILLAPSGKQSLCSIDSHLCQEDTYFGQLHYNRQNLRLNWRVIGPKKNEEMDYFYT